MAFKDVLLTLVIATLAMLMHSSVVVNGQNNINFTVTFDLTRQAGSYNTFISSLRLQLADGTRYAGGVPMLNEEQRYRTQYFHLNLISGNSQITLRIRMGDLYFVAYHAGNVGRWYEFQPTASDPRLFSDTTLLPFPSSYPRDGSLTQTMVGRIQLANVIELLAIYNPPPNTIGGTVNRQQFMTLMVMFSEALRFNPVADFAYTHIHDLNTDAPIGDYLMALLNSWGDLSAEMRRSDLFAYFNELRNIGVSNTLQAASILGLVLWSTRGPGPSSKASFSTMSSSTNALGDITTKGRQLVEIFSVQILNIDNENPGDLYGNIKVVDALTSDQYIFSRASYNHQSIRPNEFVQLIGPTRAISAYDSFNINVYLMDYDTSSADDEVSNGQITWNYFANNVYDQLLSQEVKGQYGSIVVNYAIYSNAVTATVQVTLINGDDENPANVYGKLYAYNTLSNGVISLFNKKSDERVDIRPLQLIPLSRSVVVVPLTSSIKIVADLWDYDYSSPDDAISQGSLTFVAADSGTNTGRISGKYGQVEVKITWSSSWT